MTNILSIENLSYSYHDTLGETFVLNNVTFNVREGEFLAIVGPSGCGKSTLLSVIAGLINADSGCISVNEHPLASTDKRIGYMLQKDHLLEWKTTYKNIILGLEIQKRVNSKNLAYINSLIDSYGLRDFVDRYPNELSGGMRQRAALIRTLSLEPDILLLDEPFSALDYQTRLLVSDDICSIIRNEGKTAILITHDIAEAVSTADRVIVFSYRPATVHNIIDIHLSGDNRSPLSVRNTPEFSHYFNLIWKELVHDECKD